MNDCIFCEIGARRLPASIVYEDDTVMCFMDIQPVNEGACMVIPKKHIDHFTDISDELASHILITAQKVGRKLLTELNPARIGYVVHGYGVAHAHLNIVPLNDDTDIASGKYALVVDGQVKFDHKMVAMIPRDELDRLASTLQI